MIAVGLEQIVWDQEDQEEEDFIEKFKETEYKLRSLLCEIQVAIIERGLDMRPDVRRDIMTDPYRNMSNTTSRYFRDWVIFRDYMNALEYVVDVFRHFKKNLWSSPLLGGRVIRARGGGLIIAQRRMYVKRPWSKTVIRHCDIATTPRTEHVAY